MTKISAAILAFAASLTISFANAVDTDGDGVDDTVDNCSELANPDQRDSNGDGFGNPCDMDLNNDLIVNVVDLGLLRSVFFTSDPDADSNGDGVVNVVDLGALRTQFFQPPGPGAVSAPFNQRVYQILEDVDFNGLPDAITTAEYYPDGRIQHWNYSEPDDGTPNPFSPPGVPQDGLFTYRADGQVDTLTFALFLGNLVLDFAATYTYSPDARLERIDGQQTLVGNTTASLDEVTYTGDKLTGINRFEGPPGTQLPLETITERVFDDLGRIQSNTATRVVDSMRTTTNTYQWNADNTLARRENTIVVPGQNTIVRVTHFIYEDGRLTKREIFEPTEFDPLFTEHWNYDLSGRLETLDYDNGSDGTIDAIRTYFWEDGPCVPFETPLTLDGNNAAGGISSGFSSYAICHP